MVFFHARNGFRGVQVFLNAGWYNLKTCHHTLVFMGWIAFQVLLKSFLKTWKVAIGLIFCGTESSWGRLITASPFNNHLCFVGRFAVCALQNSLRFFLMTYVLWDGFKLRSFDNGITSWQQPMFCGTVCSLRSSEFVPFLSDHLRLVGRMEAEVFW